MKAGYISSIGDIAGICGGDLFSGSAGRSIDTITTDSRDLGRRNLFIPLEGEKFDGHDFIEPLCRNGSIEGFLTMKHGFENIAREKEIAGVMCGNTLHALGAIAASWRKKTAPVLIGVTGTNGKTTVKELLYSLLKVKFLSHKNEKNYNNEIGVPFSLLDLKPGHRMAVIEMGMNHPGELDRLSKISSPDAAVITNIGEGHLEFLGSLENVARAKCEIMNGMAAGSTLFLNRDSECFGLARDYARERGIEVRTFGLSRDAHIHPDGFRLFPDRVELGFMGEVLSAPLYGIHNVYNVLAAAGVAVHYGVGAKEMNRALADFRNVGGRSQVIDNGYIVINDTYNSNPLSSRYALRSAGEVFKGKRMIAVLSDMKELGRDSEAMHEKIGRELAGSGFQYLLTWGDMSDAYVRGAMESGMDGGKALVFSDKKGIIKFLTENISPNDVILVKGSRSMKMEEIVEALVN